MCYTFRTALANDINLEILHFKRFGSGIIFVVKLAATLLKKLI